MEILIDGVLFLLVVWGIVYAINVLYSRKTGERLISLNSPLVQVTAVILVLYITYEFITATPAYEVNTEKLSNEINRKGRAAFDKYRNKLISVNGVYLELDDSLEQPSLLMSAGSKSNLTVRCYFSKSSMNTAVTLMPGQQITVRGVFSGNLDEVFLNDCLVVE